MATEDDARPDTAQEGGLGTPVRHAIDWQDPDFHDVEKLDAELRRVFDICHGCRRCFNLCDSFPRLFDLIDGSETGELDAVDSAGFKPVIDACTLCDMCFMTKCPYVPPHAFNLDFPHLMLRSRAVEQGQGKVAWGGAAADQNRPQRPPGRAGHRSCQLGRQRQEPAGAAGPGRRGRGASRGGAAEVPWQDIRHAGQGGRARTQSRGAGVRSQGGALCDLLRQLQQSRSRDSGAADPGQERRRDRGRPSTLLRHAATGAG